MLGYVFEQILTAPVALLPRRDDCRARQNANPEQKGLQRFLIHKTPFPE